MSAHRKHISKYTQQYLQTFPAAEILILESTVSDVLNTSLSHVFSSRAQHLHDRLATAREVLLYHLTSPDLPQRRIIMHAFSNGGAVSALNLITTLPACHRQNAFNAVILDSCPGEGTYQRSVHAFSLSLPKHPLAQIIGVPLIHLMICMFGLFFILFNAEHVMAKIRRQLNDSTFFDVRVPRLYVYSDADELVLGEDVASHAEDARGKGFVRVQEVRFEDSRHCAHALAHGEEYWGAVGRVVAQSVG